MRKTMENARRSPAATKELPLRFLGVLRDLAVNLHISIHRQDAKNAGKLAKKKLLSRRRWSFVVQAASTRRALVTRLSAAGILIAFFANVAVTHPLGNFTVNHFTRIEA